MNGKIAKQIRKIAPMIQAKIAASILAKGGDPAKANIPSAEFIEKQLKRAYKSQGVLPNADIRVRRGDVTPQ
jgi:hypothetical protein